MCGLYRVLAEGPDIPVASRALLFVFSAHPTCGLLGVVCICVIDLMVHVPADSSFEGARPSRHPGSSPSNLPKQICLVSVTTSFVFFVLPHDNDRAPCGIGSWIPQAHPPVWRTSLRMLVCIRAPPAYLCSLPKQDFAHMSARNGCLGWAGGLS